MSDVRPHKLQDRALARLTERLADNGRAVVVMPCGSGKTLLGRWLAEDLHARLTVVFVPTLALVPQTLMAYRSLTSWRHASMIVCSDPTSGRAVRLTDLDLPDWTRTAVASSTSPRAVDRFLDQPGPKVVVSTYHSAPAVAVALRSSRRTADLVVCDEAHRLTGRPRDEFRTVLDDRALPARRRVFLTATPVEAAAWEADNGEADDALYLDDTATFGPTVYAAAFADAVAEGLLCDYDVEILATRDGDTKSADPIQAVLAAARDGASRILTFHSRVAHAGQLAGALDGTTLPDGRTVRAEHIEARHNAHRRAGTLTRLADCADDEVRVVASARVLSEGVDVPAVDTVLFAAPRTSAVDIVQAVGRAMRTAPGKQRGRVVLTVALDRDDLDVDTQLADTAWRHVWVVLRALASMDPRFTKTLRACTRHAPWPGGSRPHAGPGLYIGLPEGLALDRWVLRALDRTGSSWWHNLDVLRSWTAEHGHARPSSTVQHIGVAIGSWVTRQRTMHKDGLLQPDQVSALEALPGWAWTKLDTAWWQGWAKWLAYHQEPGRPQGHAERWADLARHAGHGNRGKKPHHAYATLAAFAVDTCARYRRGDLPRHLERAAGLLPAWSWHPLPTDDARMVDALVEYAAWKGDFNPPHDYRHDDGLPLGAWLTAVRRRRCTGRLDPILELELEHVSSARPSAVGLRWEPRETAWRLGYLALRQFADRENTCRVPYQHVESLPDHELNLSRWCVVQRQQRRLGQLTASRVAALEQVPGWRWEVELRDGYRPVLDDAQHGTRAGYAKGCKCDDCTEANNTYNRRNDTNGTDLVPATAARGHLRLLEGRGAVVKAMARAADLNVKTVTEVKDGTLVRVRPETEQAILTLTLQAAKDAEKPGRWETVPAGPTWALIDDMLARGWPKAWISREIGRDGRALQLKRTSVSVQNAQAVADLHRRLRGRVPPPRECRTPLPTLAEILTAEEQRRAS